MGNCIPASVEVIEVSDEDRRRHREAEWSLKKVRVQYSHPFFFFFQRTYTYLPGPVLFNSNDSVFQAKQKMVSQVKVRTRGSFLL